MARIHKHNVVNISSTRPIIVDLPDLNIMRIEESELKDVHQTQDLIETVNPIVEYQRLINEAESYAKEISKNAEKDIEKSYHKARSEGYQKGLEEANIILDKQKEFYTNEYTKLVEDFLINKQVIFDQWEEEILNLSLEVASKILNVELDKNDECIVNIVKKAIGKLSNDTKVLVKISPEDIFKFEGNEEIDYRTGKGTIHAKIVCDSGIGKGGCIVETETGIIDSGIQSQLGKISKILKEGI